jgi:hypothetical protein
MSKDAAGSGANLDAVAACRAINYINFVSV